jgi:hypothetical protein
MNFQLTIGNAYRDRCGTITTEDKAIRDMVTLGEWPPLLAESWIRSGIGEQAALKLLYLAVKTVQ